MPDVSTATPIEPSLKPDKASASQAGQSKYTSLLEPLTITMTDEEIIALVVESYEKGKSDKQDYMSKVAEWRDADKGELCSQSNPALSSFEMNISLATRMWFVANLIEPFTSTVNIFRAHPETGSSQQKAETHEALLNYELTRKNDRYQFFEDLFNLAYRDGMCMIATGWRHRIGYDDEHIIEADDIEDLLDDYENNVSQGYVDLEAKTNKKGDVTAVRMAKPRIVYDNPFAEIQPIDNFIFDATSSDISKDQLLIVLEEVTVTELLRQDKRRNKKGAYDGVDEFIRDNKDLIATDQDAVRTEAQTKANQVQFSDTPRNRITLMHYWGNLDLNGDGIAEEVCVTIANRKKVLRKIRNIYPDKKPPYVPVFFEKDINTKYGVSGHEYTKDYQKILTQVSRMIIDKAAFDTLGVNIINKNAYDDIELKRFDTPSPGMNIYTKSDVPAQTIHKLDGGQIPQHLQFIIEWSMGNVENLSGFTRYSGGMDASSLNKTARGLSAIMTQSQKRLVKIATSVADRSLKCLARKWAAYNQVFMSPMTIQLVTGDFVDITTADIDGAMDFDVSVNVRGVDEEKIAQITQLLQYTAPLAQTNTIPPWIVTHLISKLYELFGQKEIALEIENMAKQQRSQLGNPQGPMQDPMQDPMNSGGDGTTPPNPPGMQPGMAPSAGGM